MAIVPACALAGPLKLVALGDSLTQGYGLPTDEGFVPQLQAWLIAEGRDVTVINAGVSGDTTEGGLARLDWTLSDAPDAMIVTLGGNDLLRGLPPEESRANLDALLSETKARGLPVLLVPMIAPGNYGADYKAEFDAMYHDLSAAHGTLLADPFLAPIAAAAEAGTPLSSLMQPDGLHPNAEGVALVVEALGPDVLKLLDSIGG